MLAECEAVYLEQASFIKSLPTFLSPLCFFLETVSQVAKLDLELLSFLLTDTELGLHTWLFLMFVNSNKLCEKNRP